MAKLDEHARMTIQTLAQKGLSNRETARLLGITEGAVRYQLRRMQEEAPDGRSQCTGRTDAYAEAIDACSSTIASPHLGGRRRYRHEKGAAPPTPEAQRSGDTPHRPGRRRSFRRLGRVAPPR